MGNNFFLPLPPILAGASGAQAPIDLNALVPTTGLNEHLTFICKGDVTDGYIAIEGSPNGITYDGLGQFTFGSDADGMPGPALEPKLLVVDATVRFIRTFVQANVRATTAVTVAGEQNCDCISGGGAPSQSCPDITLDEDGERSSTGGAEDIVAEWYVDMSTIAQIGLTMGAFFSGIMRTAGGQPGNLARLRVGSSAPGVADGLIVGTLTTANVVDTPLATQSTPPNPGGPVLVQVTLQAAGPNGGGDTVFLRGFVAQFSCPIFN
jgi:hypothetical protein